MAKAWTRVKTVSAEHRRRVGVALADERVVICGGPFCRGPWHGGWFETNATVAEQQSSSDATARGNGVPSASELPTSTIIEP